MDDGRNNFQSQRPRQLIRYVFIIIRRNDERTFAIITIGEEEQEEEQFKEWNANSTAG